jgi:hypothetical protein
MSSSKIFIDPLVGNVGIGVANPTAKLHVLGNARIQGDLIVNGSQTTVNNYTTVSSNVSIMNTSGVGPALRVAQTGSGAGYPVADFYDNDVSTTVPAVRIADGGNVGIGTANPQAKLHVNGEININNTINTAFTQLSVTAASLTAGYNSGGVTGPVGGVYTYTIGNGDTNSGFTHPVVLDVGTTYEFTITASSINGLLWRIENPVFTDVSSVVTTPTLTSYSTTFRAVNATVVLRIYGSSGQTFKWNSFVVKRLDILTNGNLGIGTANPQGKLHVNGSIKNRNSAFHAYVNNAVGPNQRIVYDVVVCNIGGNYNNTTGVFTVPMDGTYMFTANGFAVYQNTSYVMFSIRKNNNSVSYGHGYFASHAAGSSASYIAELVSGDEIDVIIPSAGYASLNGGQGTHFNGHMIG